MGKGNESLFVKSGLHDQDCRHAHIWLKPLKNVRPLHTRNRSEVTKCIGVQVSQLIKRAANLA